MKKTAFLITVLLLGVFTEIGPLAAGDNEQVCFYDIEISAPFEIRRSSLKVNLFMVELKALFLEGYFSNRWCLFEEEGGHERRIDLRVSQFEDRELVFILITYTGPEAVGDYMLEYRFASVYRGPSRRSQSSGKDNSFIDSVTRFVADRVDEMNITREYYARNAEMCAEDIMRTIERMKRGVL